jgi:hypothetical protein
MGVKAVPAASKRTFFWEGRVPCSSVALLFSGSPKNDWEVALQEAKVLW